MEPPARPHGISPQSFLVCLPDLRDWVTVAFWTLLSYVSSSAKRALYQVSVRQATISLSLLLACTSRCKPWESLWGSSATTPLMDFHHRLTACPSYVKKSANTLFCVCGSAGVPGFEPPKSVIADLQSAPFGHSGIHPHLRFYNTINIIRFQDYFCSFRAEPGRPQPTAAASAALHTSRRPVPSPLRAYSRLHTSA